MHIQFFGQLIILPKSMEVLSKFQLSNYVFQVLHYRDRVLSSNSATLVLVIKSDLKKTTLFQIITLKTKKNMCELWPSKAEG